MSLVIKTYRLNAFGILKAVIFLIALTAASCHRPAMTDYQPSSLRLLDSTHTATDPKIDKIIQPYKDQLSEEIQMVVGYTAHPMSVQKPESDLGNLLSDFLLQYSRKFIDTTISFALFNTGGFRIPLPPGDITVRHVMELMPFDNTLVTIRVSGEQLSTLGNQILERGGDPIAGLDGVTIKHQGDSLLFLIGNLPVLPEKEYVIVTSSYLADGGDRYSVFTNFTKKYDSGILIRDALRHQFQTTTDKTHPATSSVVGRIILPKE